LQILDRLPGRIFFDARAIKVFDTQNNFPIMLASEQPIHEECSRITQVQGASG
jgi:hypothetical protein